MADDAVLNKIRALLNKAESTKFPAEAEAFAAKAEELMMRHAIDAAMLADADPAKADEIIITSVRLEQPHLTVKGVFLFNLAKVFGVKGAYRVQNGRDHEGHLYSVMDLVGYKGDVTWVETLFTSLEMQRVTALAVALRTRDRREGGKTFTSSFNEAYRRMVTQRVRDTRVTAVAETAPSAGGTSTALVLVAREERVEAEFRAHFPNARTSAYKVQYNSHAGRVAGARAGSTAGIARGSLSGEKRALR